MDDRNRCTKHFPKPFLSNTEITGDSYVHTRRRDNGRFVRVGNHHVDNRYVVSYSPYLTLCYEAHINVECTAGFHAVKYIYKVCRPFHSMSSFPVLHPLQYLYKGPDRASLSVHRLNDPDGTQFIQETERDKTKIYVDGRYISAPEAFWRLNGWPTHRVRHPFVDTSLVLPLLCAGIPTYHAAASSSRTRTIYCVR